MDSKYLINIWKKEEGGHPINGLVYEIFANGMVNYYCYYENGIQNGEYANFYKTGKVKRYCSMKSGQISGNNTTWYESGKIKLIEFCKYGIVISFEKYKENKVLIDSKTEPSNIEKKLLAKYEKLYEKSE